MTKKILVASVALQVAIAAQAQGYNIASVATDGVVTLTAQNLVQPMLTASVTIIGAAASGVLLARGARLLFHWLSSEAYEDGGPDPNDADDIRNYDTTDWSQEKRDEWGIKGDGTPYEH